MALSRIPKRELKAERRGRDSIAFRDRIPKRELKASSSIGSVETPGNPEKGVESLCFYVHKYSYLTPESRKGS